MHVPLELSGGPQVGTLAEAEEVHRDLRESPQQVQEKGLCESRHLEYTQMALSPGNRKGKERVLLVWLPSS